MAGTRRIHELEALIAKHQDLYYNGQPEIGDAEFDALWDELGRLDPDNALLSKVGADAEDGFSKAEHLMPMGSQEKASDPEAFLKWAAKIAHPEYLVQYKLDGASLELQYSKGGFIKAVTRGDGQVGDDISANVRKMKGFVARLDETFSGGVRGEVIMSHQVHDEHFADKANCRNAANGLMKRKDGEGSQHLQIICYDARHSTDDAFFLFERDKLRWLAAQGFSSVEQKSFETPEAVVDYRAHVMDLRASLPYDIDGLVVKGDAIDHEDMKRARPEKQIAFKFSLEEAISTLRQVEWSESGAIYTPIGIIDPVKLAGTTVKRANLCNPDMLRKLELKLGSRIVITKRGEIIPKIEGLVENPPDATDIHLPETCSCGATLVDEGTRLVCPNKDCPKKAYHRLRKWLDVIDVKEFGDALLGKLFESGRVRTIPELYSLRAEELSSLERMGDTSAQKVIKNLSAKGELSLAAFIAGFDLEGIGELIADRFVQAGYRSLDAMQGALPEELSGIFGVGELTAAAFVAGLKEVRTDMDRLLASGAIKIKDVSGGPLEGLTFCFTGELKTVKRGEAENLVKDRGGGCKSSVVKGLSYLVTNDTSSGSAKNKKAGELGIPIIDEEAFLELIGGKT
jgi:DNA ligase (NAD+)